MTEPSAPVRIYHYERLIGEWPTRFHLRVDPDGDGVLLANAAEAAYLSPLGVLVARGVLEGRGEDAIKRDVRRNFRRASASALAADLVSIHRLIADLSAPGDNYPITNLDDPRVSEWRRELAAPLRADVVPTDVTATKDVFLRLWEAGIPHVTILVQPGGNAANLPLIGEAAEDIGMITGLRAVASWLSPEVIEQTAMAGLDHLDLVYLSTSPQIHDEVVGPGDYQRAVDAFGQCTEVELCPVAQIPIIQSNAEELEEIVANLQGRGITNLTFFALACPDDDAQAQAAGALPARALPQVATTITEAAEETEARYLWAPPVRFASCRSLAEQVRAGPRTAGDVAIRVAADGRVFPPRGPDCGGNLLTQPWTDIWDHECFTRYRERLRAPTRCPDCPDLEICAADCPKDPRGWSDDTQGGEEP